jgi:hypothetical protein
MNDNDKTVTSMSELPEEFIIDAGNIDLSSVYSSTMAGTYQINTQPYYGNITVTNGTGAASPNLGQYVYSVGNLGIGTVTPSQALHVSGDAEFDGDIKIKGKSILKMLEGIEKRLAILQPDPAKLEKYAALRKAYEHYKTLEALCDLEEKKED